MTTLTCRCFTKDCPESLTAADSTEIQKVFLAHVHVKHMPQWSQFSSQFKAISMVTMRDRFQTQAAEGLKVGIPALSGAGESA